MKLNEILEVIDKFFDEKQEQMNAHIVQFGTEGKRDIDSREKSMLLTLPVGYRKKLKEKFVELGDKA